MGVQVTCLYCAGHLYYDAGHCFRGSSRGYSNIAMAQHDDFSNPSSRPNSLGESGLTNGSGEFNGAGQGSVDGDWRNRSSSTARRRNQWRQYKYMTPDFGTSGPDPEAPSPSIQAAAQPSTPAASRQAALPSFNLKGGPTSPTPAHSPSPAQGVGAPRLPQSPRASGLQPPVAQAASPPFPSGARPSAPGSSVSLHPHSSSLGQGSVSPSPTSRRPSPATEQSPTKVTPMRPRDSRRRTVGMAAGMAAAATAATTAGLAALAAPPQREGTTQRTRRFSPQRRLAKLPLPALYVMRLAILGIGVAAIAGTLLSMFSPSNVTSNGSGETTTALTTRNGNANALPGQGAVTITAIQPSSELTRLKAQLDQLATLTPGLTPTVYAFDIDSGRYVDLNGTEAVAAASTIKMPILVAFLQQVDAGNLALNQALVLQEQHLAGGSGTLANDAIGSEYTALDVATRMIVHSDNTATNMMIEALGGPEALNQQFVTWGLEATALRNILPDLEGTNTTSTRDLALLMALVDQGDVLSRRSRERLFSIMQRTVNRSLIAFSLTDGSLVANKTGDIAMALGDVALVDTPNGNRYALAVMVQRPNNDGRASELIRRITEAVHRELNQPIAPVGRPVTPGESAPPGDSASPDGSGNPDGTVNPEGTVSPEGSVNPEDTVSPEGSVNPEGSVAPEDTLDNPEPMPEADPNTPPTGDQIPPG